MGHMVQPYIDAVDEWVGRVSSSNVNGISEPIIVFPTDRDYLRGGCLMVQNRMVYIQNTGICPKPKTVFCIIKPDEIVRPGKSDCPCKGSVYAQAAKGTDIIFKHGVLILPGTHWLQQHQAGVFYSASVKAVDLAVCHNRARTGKIRSIFYGICQFFHIRSLNHGIVINDQEPITGCMGHFFKSKGKTPCTAQILFHMEGLQPGLLFCKVI